MTGNGELLSHPGFEEYHSVCTVRTFLVCIADYVANDNESTFRGYKSTSTM